ncbi:N2,N2-dimethylguanosine tRNA methyltransferase [Allomyces macrogynus ATCC 38327]|uniref:tRNA (guanine(26)-N(2))-dimethyltransferase n=1 Tax=Allomyces macrogynus (strain ATCC 38327) TaxID=578462 RepID=A0A0L0S8A5_ALLM3|nr:N2,N2-dimethylguanosine tRNA methyltransferase [Allomyces macrogynus ATCC 38327]|eukprot:KNE58640.1 N2,N2-dimethylguanosine tRNA methyltransferase [Allomyces macrogynus ATCC 38327]
MAAHGEATYNDEQFNTVSEGQATILFPKNNEVFYNPVQQFNRDMSIAAIRTWRDVVAEERWAKALKKEGKTTDEAKAAGETVPVFKPKILEALAASGLRSVRYAKEIPDLDHILCNDLDPEAVESIKRNVAFNNLSEELVRPNLGDAKIVMYQHLMPKDHYHVVDLDPYGSASPFLDAAVQSVSDGGLMCITCTDMQVLAGANFTETCFTKYGGMPLRGEFTHEMALRLLLGATHTAAAKNKRYIEPLVSCSIDFYIRVFVRVHVSPIEDASRCAAAHGQGHRNDQYGLATHHAGANCAECGSNFHIGGPAWNAPLHSKPFVQRMLAHARANAANYGTAKRMEGMLTVICEEVDAPLYYTLRALTTAVHCNSISLIDMGSALANAGYQFSVSHANPIAVKTDAPQHVVWDVIRAHVKRGPAKEPAEGSIAAKILAKEITTTVDFKFHKASNPPSRKIKLVRFQENPEKNWGPKARAGKKRKANADAAAQPKRGKKAPKTEPAAEQDGAVEDAAEDAAMAEDDQ